MEQLLHYVWQHRMFPLGEMHTTDGRMVEVIDPGLHNLGAGPDFFNAKVRIDGQLWVGNVEIHLRSTDWYRHHHETDEAYNNVVLHVVQMKDCDVETRSGLRLPTLELPVPQEVEANYRELLAEESYPPCYRVIPQLSQLVVHSWMSALTVERLETKTERINAWLERTTGDWEQTFFIVLARAFGFGNNSDTLERWAASINPQHICKHRDHPEQVTAFFLGQAGLLDKDDKKPVKAGAPAIAGLPEISDETANLLLREWRFLQTKFRLTPLPRSSWKMGRLRPQNFPQVRLVELAGLYHSHRLDFSRIRAAKSIDELRALLTASTQILTSLQRASTPLAAEEETATTTTKKAKSTGYTLSEASVDLLIINAVAPILFAYGRSHNDEALTERAFELLEAIKPEHNYITRSWAKAGITSQHAADSQALIELRTHYCDRKDCLRCRFGAAYLKKK